MNSVRGLILCGGQGVRLRPITYYFQKTMIPVGTKQKPLLEYVVRLFRFHSVRNLAFLVNYKSEQIFNYFDDGNRFDVKISYVNDKPDLKGTAGSVLNACKQGVVTHKDTLLVYYGDILSNMNLKNLLQYHETQQASATVALCRGFNVRVGVADLDRDNKILGFVEKPKIEKPVSMGILVLKGETIDDVEQLCEKKRDVDLMRDLVPHLIKKGKPVYGYLSDDFWYDVGSMEAYEKLNPKLVEDLLAYLF